MNGRMINMSEMKNVRGAKRPETAGDMKVAGSKAVGGTRSARGVDGASEGSHAAVHDREPAAA